MPDAKPNLNAASARNITPYSKRGEKLRQKLLPEINDPILALVNTSENVKMDREAAERAWGKDAVDFGKAGVHVYHWHVRMTMCWLGEKQYDWTELNKEVERTIKGDPKARIILRLRIMTPQWWHDLHPDQKIIYADGTSSIEEHHWNDVAYPPSMASKIWMDDVQVFLRDTVAYVESAPWADHIIGYNPALMHGGEWFEYGALYGKIADYSPVMRDGFRAWLDGQYPGEDHSQVELPTVEDRRQGDIGHLRHPIESRHVIDFYRYYNDLVAGDAERCCRTLKETAKRDALVGIYYGYTFEFAVQENMVEDFGHLALRRILHSPYVDFLTTMLHYWDRASGGFSWPFGPLLDSCRIHNMLFFNEDENHTWLNRGDSATEIYVWRASDADTAVNIFKRSFACAATHRQHEAMADLSGGWYDDPEIMKCVADMASITAKRKLDLSPIAEVAILVDEISPMYQGIAMANHLNTPLIPKALRSFFHMGTPIDLYLFSDLTDDLLPLDRYKFLVIPNAFCLTKEQREYIQTKVQRNNRHILWQYAPGFIEQNDASSDAIRNLIGIDVGYDLKPAVIQVESDGVSFGTNKEVSPVFFVNDPDVEVLGKLSDGKVGLCRKKIGESTSLYSSAPMVPARILRDMARKAGVHIYIDSDDLIHASGGLLSIHAGSDGKKHITLPGKYNLTEAFGEGPDFKSVSEFEVELSLGKTKLWIMEKQ